MENELKPCPFCGHDAILDFFWQDAFVYCLNSECRCRTGFFPIAENAIKVWNRRADNG